MSLRKCPYGHVLHSKSPFVPFGTLCRCVPDTHMYMKSLIYNMRGCSSIEPERRLLLFLILARIKGPDARCGHKGAQDEHLQVRYGIAVCENTTAQQQ